MHFPKGVCRITVVFYEARAVARNPKHAQDCLGTSVYFFISSSFGRLADKKLLGDPIP
jgi:hypothetical protein